VRFNIAIQREDYMNRKTIAPTRQQKLTRVSDDPKGVVLKMTEILQRAKMRLEVLRKDKELPSTE
jgi:hypothetical protein